LNPDPAFVLQALNRRLMVRGDARATCLALRIARDGTVALTNARHLPPYLNGEPVEIEGSLPLGFLAELDCSVLEFPMAESDWLVRMSDGVVEATNVKGELFGFERVLELVRWPSATQMRKPRKPSVSKATSA
jgi:serine phosphatase RsbU (regulator of sigma subunit)